MINSTQCRMNEQSTKALSHCSFFTWFLQKLHLDSLYQIWMFSFPKTDLKVIFLAKLKCHSNETTNELLNWIRTSNFISYLGFFDENFDSFWKYKICDLLNSTNSYDVTIRASDWWKILDLLHSWDNKQFCWLISVFTEKKLRKVSKTSD